MSGAAALTRTHVDDQQLQSVQIAELLSVEHAHRDAAQKSSVSTALTITVLTIA